MQKDSIQFQTVSVSVGLQNLKGFVKTGEDHKHTRDYTKITSEFLSVGLFQLSKYDHKRNQLSKCNQMQWMQIYLA